jgi:hypothetical protein
VEGADNFGATGKTTAQMTSFATFAAAWNSESTTVIVDGWQAPSNPTWGICAEVNGGYPFLLWQFEANPCQEVATQLGLSVQPSSSVESGVVFVSQPVVELRAASGVVVAQAGVTVTVAIASGGGTLGGTVTATTDADGVASFSGLSITGVAGDRTLAVQCGRDLRR